ncbi:DNA repair ATPase [Pontibacter ruber]|uniref:DNA repair ATPase n=1 Tax=Pontibacter ruber TaxID=1343895 RepID=A0ABW5CVZ5_9BACT|nr:DNA repair ATPase [Pontibacter ruber]
MKGILLGLFLLTAGVAQAQSVKLEEQEQSVNGVTRRGQQLTVQLDQKLVEKLWKEHLSDKAGKIKSSKGVYTVEGAEIKDISKEPMRVVSQVGSNGLGSYVWWSLDMGVAYVDKDATPKEYAAAEDFMREFARKLYREDVLRQINQAEDVLRSTKSEQDRVVKQANDLQLSIEKNKKRRKDLEAELVRNAEDLKQLEREVELNEKQQAASREQVRKMEKAVEEVKDKLKDMK